MHKLTYRIISLTIALLILCVVVVILMENGDVSGTPRKALALSFGTPGTLTFSNGAPSSPNPVVLSNADQTETYTIAITVDDSTGSGDGWNLQVTMTQFTNGSGKTLAKDVTTIDNPTISACQGGSCTLPTNTISSGSYPLATTTDGTTSTKFFSAQTNTGLGSVIITPTFSTTIQARAYAGTYTSTFTFMLNSGP